MIASLSGLLAWENVHSSPVIAKKSQKALTVAQQGSLNVVAAYKIQTSVQPTTPGYGDWLDSLGYKRDEDPERWVNRQNAFKKAQAYDLCHISSINPVCIARMEVC